MNSIPGREPRADTLDINQPKETQPHQKTRNGVLLGTDFRHAVEFSRSGRAETPASRPSSRATLNVTPSEHRFHPRGFNRLPFRPEWRREDCTPSAAPVQGPWRG